MAGGSPCTTGRAISVLSQLRREIRHDDRIGAPRDVAVLARTVAAEWRARAAAPAAASPGWQAYLAGGAHALEAPAEEVYGAPDLVE